MSSKKLNVVALVGLAALLFMVFDCLTGKAGSLEPNAPPQPTMVTLGEISAQIAALSSPVEKVVRGLITFQNGGSEQYQNFSPAVDPNRCVVLLSDSVATEHTTADYPDWLGRTGACLVDLTDSQITVCVEPHPANQKVSYQIIEYK
ncbi:hypothetical protein ES703_95067 [subsurface metagenome]